MFPTGIGIVPMTERMLSSIFDSLPWGKTFHRVKGGGITEPFYSPEKSGEILKAMVA
jgi:hypothetical protein